jgi:hypothetical protein
VQAVQYHPEKGECHVASADNAETAPGMTSQSSILYPVMAMAALTFAVLLFLPYKRIGGAIRGRVRAHDFKYGESANVPPDIAVANRNFMNLLEMPLLFYIACITFYVTKTADGMALFLAWLYFALRVAHSLVHLTYNKVIHRFACYAASNVVLAVMWIRLFLALVR